MNERREISHYQNHGYPIQGQASPGPSGLNLLDLAPEREIDLEKYWRVIRRHLWSILGLSGSVMVLTFLILLTLTPIYQGKASIIIEPQIRQKVVAIEDVVNTSNITGAEYFMTQIEVLKSHAIARRVIDALPEELKTSDPEDKPKPPAADEGSFWPDWMTDLFGGSEGSEAGVPKEAPLEMTYEDQLAEKLIKHLTITPTRNTHIIQIAFEDPSPKRAMLVANLIGNAYIDSQNDWRLEASQQSSRWLADRVEKLRIDLQGSERRLSEYVESQGLVNLETSGLKGQQGLGVLSLSADELNDRQAKLIEAHKVRVELETQYEQLSSRRGASLDAQSALPGVYDNPGIQALRAQETQVLGEVKHLQAKYGPAHPERRAAESKLQGIRSSIQTQIGTALVSLRNQLAAAKRNERALSEGLEKSKAKVQEIGRKDSRLGELRREVESNRNLYELFLNRLKETTETQNLASTTANLLDRAAPPTRPYKPQKVKITLLAGLLALLAGIGLAFLMEQLDTSLKSPEDIEERLGAPFLGVLPFDDDTGEGKSVSYDEHSLTGFAEAVRSIRTGVIFSTLNVERPVIMITSSSPGEGKSTVILNLAASMAGLKRVVVIDMDLRKPQVGRRFGLPPKAPGFCNFVVGDGQLEDCIHPIRDNLDVIPSGRIPPNPLEMLSAPRVGELIETLRSRYDLVILDAPPLGPVSDPLIITRHANAVLFVVRAQKSQVRLVRQAIGKLRRVSAPLHGVILNFAEPMRESYYRYNYRNYYQYGYGYGEYRLEKQDHEAERTS